MFADFDPGTLTGFFVLLLCGVAVFICVIGAAVSLMLKKWKALKQWAVATGISVIGAVGLFYGTIFLGRIFHWL